MKLIHWETAGSTNSNPFCSEVQIREAALPSPLSLSEKTPLHYRHLLLKPSTPKLLARAAHSRQNLNFSVR